MVDDDELDSDAQSVVVVDAPEWFKVEGVGDVAQGRGRRCGGDGSPAMVWWCFLPLSALPLDQSRV